MNGLALALTACVLVSPDDAVDERGPTRLLVVDGALVREGPDGQRLIRCTSQEGTGRVRSLATDPAGATFVAAERGLFVLSPGVDHSTPVHRSGDAPTGAPTEVVVDRGRRVWITTENAVGCLEPSFGWGRTVDAAVLPGGAPFDLELVEGRAVVSDAAGNVHRPDPTRAPDVESVRIGGTSVPDGGQVDLPHGDRPRLSASGTGDGGATFRYRVDGHHVWRALDDPIGLQRLDPGTRLLEIIAIDHDLDRSDPWRVVVEVAMPPALRTGSVLWLGGLCATLLLGGFLWARRRRGRGVRWVWRAFVSTSLALWLTLQVLAGVFPHGRGWPFVGYSMYSGRYQEGDVVSRPMLRFVTPRGTTRVQSPFAVGRAIDDPWQLLRSLIDGSDAHSGALLDEVNARRTNAAYTEIQVVVLRTLLSRKGPVEVAPLVLHRHAAPPAGPSR